MQMDFTKKAYADIKAYDENFEFRERIIDVSLAVKILIYPNCFIVNKTAHEVLMPGQSIPSKSNDFLTATID